MTVWCGDLLISPFPFFSYLAALNRAFGGSQILDAPPHFCEQFGNVNVPGLRESNLVK